MNRFENFPLLEEEFVGSTRAKEGWGITIHKTAPRICNEKTGQFKDDKETYHFVKQRATEGSEYHQQALAYIVSKRLTK